MKKFILFNTVLWLLVWAVMAVAGNNKLGTGAGANITSAGKDNIIIGDGAGKQLITGDNNVIVGTGALPQGADVIGSIRIGNIAGGLDTTDYKLFIQSYPYSSYGIFGILNTGRFGINTTTPTYNWQVSGTSYYSGLATFAGGTTMSDRFINSDTLFVSKEQTPVGADSSMYLTTASGNPFMGFRATDGDLTNVTVNTSDQLLFQGAGGGYIFDDRVVTSDTLAVSKEQRPDLADSSMYFTHSSGNPFIGFLATDGDLTNITVNTSDQLLFAGASGGYLFTGPVLLRGLAASGDTLQNWRSSTGNTVAFMDSTGKFKTRLSIPDTVNATNIVATGYSITNGTIIGRAAATITGAVTADSAKVNGPLYQQQKTIFIDANTSPLAAHSGAMFVARPITAKRSILLPAAVTDLWYDIFVADADSLRIVAASGDSILISTGVASQSAGSVAGTCRVKALDDVRWLIMNAVGTWTQDDGTQ